MKKSVAVAMVVVLLLLPALIVYAGGTPGARVMAQGENDGTRTSTSVMGHPQYGEPTDLPFSAYEPYDVTKVWTAIDYGGQLWSSRAINLDSAPFRATFYVWAGPEYTGETINFMASFGNQFHPDSFVEDLTLYNPDGTVRFGGVWLGNGGYVNATIPTAYASLDNLSTAYRGTIDFNGPVAVPEPVSIVAIVTGLVGCGLLRRRK